MTYAISYPVLKAGDILSVNRSPLHIRNLYKHYGIYIGNNKVVHFTALGCSRETNAKLAYIQETSLQEFIKGGLYQIEKLTFNIFSRTEIVQRAKESVGHGLGTYSLIFNNCEHFANWCATGISVSSQVNRVAKRLLGNRGLNFFVALSQKRFQKNFA
ncbi:MAG: lecithin retinol acyltransferase family protein [Spirochaetaceae bacterium]|nr:lecithin retinol acyltransferase family protein [Spirochaetaceae bacterium]